MTCIFYPFAMDETVVAGLEMFFFARVCANASFVSIALISVDRFLIVACPFRHRQWMKGKSLLFWLSVIWLTAFILPTFQLLYGERVKKYAMNYFSLFFVVLSLIMYATTYAIMKKHSRSIGQQNSLRNRAQEIRMFKENRFLKTIIFIASVAFICSVLSLICFQINSLALARNTAVYDTVTQASVLIFNINFAINPFIYTLRLSNYRKTFKLVYYRKLKIIIRRHTEI